MYSSTLRPCSVGLAPSSGLFPTSRPPRSSHLPLTLGPGGGSSLKLKLINPRSAGGVVRAHTGEACDRQVMDHDFREGRDQIEHYFKEILDADGLRSESSRSRGYLCRIAKNSVRLASVIMGKPGNIFQDTLVTKLMTPTKLQNQALRLCVRTFVNTAKYACHDKVTKGTIFSFLRALEHLAYMSYFVGQDTLANVGDYLNYRPEFDADRDLSEYIGKMDTLKHNLDMARPEEDRVLTNIVSDAMLLTEIFVMSMTTCRGSALLGLTLGVSMAAPV